MEYIKLSDKSIYISDGNYSAKYPRAEEMVDAGIPFITPANFEGDKISLKEMNYITEEKHSVLQKGHIKENDVLITVRGNNGRVMMVTSDFENANINAQLAFIRTDCSKIFPKYIYYYFNSNIAKLYISKNETGIALKQFPIKKLLEVTIPLVSKDKQQEIVSILDKINAIIDSDKKQLELLDETIKSRFIEMFMDKGYPTIPLKELSISKAEYGASSASVPFEEGRPRYVRITDINDDGTLNDDVVCSINPQDDVDYKLSYGDFMFARMGATVGKTYAYFDGNEIYAGYLIRYKLDLNKLNPRYLFTYSKLNEYLLWVKNNQSGAAQPGINAKKYDLLPIPVAPIASQNEFASFVELIDKSKFNIQQHLNLMQELLDKKMDEFFGGE